MIRTSLALYSPDSASYNRAPFPQITWLHARSKSLEGYRMTDTDAADPTDANNPIQLAAKAFQGSVLVPAMKSALLDSRVFAIFNADNVEIPVRGFGEDQRGTPVLMLHGLQSHSGWFVQSGQAIAKQGCPLYAIERRGSGLSRQPRGHADSYHEMLDDINTVADWAVERHGTQQVHILGHCFGAIPATAYACQHPDRVRTLILPTPGIHTNSDLSVWQKLRIVFAILTGRHRLPIPVPLSTSLFTGDTDYQTFIQNDALSLLYATASLYREVPRIRCFVRQHVSHLRIPVFMAIAGMDRICNNEQNKDFFATIASERKQLLEYKRAVHILEFSPDRDEFFRDLADWLTTS